MHASTRTSGLQCGGPAWLAGCLVLAASRRRCPLAAAQAVQVVAMELNGCHRAVGQRCVAALGPPCSTQWPGLHKIEVWYALGCRSGGARYAAASGAHGGAGHASGDATVLLSPPGRHAPRLSQPTAKKDDGNEPTEIELSDDMYTYVTEGGGGGSSLICKCEAAKGFRWVTWVPCCPCSSWCTSCALSCAQRTALALAARRHCCFYWPSSSSCQFTLRERRGSCENPHCSSLHRASLPCTRLGGA